MGITCRIITIATAVLAFSTPSFAQEEPTKETVIVVANGTEITLGHVLSLASRLPDQFLGVADKDLFAGIVDQLVQQELLRSLITEETAELKLAIENERRALIAGEAIKNIYSAALSEDAIQQRYAMLYKNADPIPEYNPRHILVETESEAKEIVKLLADGGDFAQLAKEKSTGPTGAKGGDLGWVGPGQFVPEFEAAMAQLKEGEVSAPVKTQFGWHVIELVKVRDQAVPELAVVLNEIEEALKVAALEKRISELEASGGIVRSEQEINPSFVKKFELLEN
jgi:peptidyl-prolyl cis-trans isomerase C